MSYSLATIEEIEPDAEMGEVPPLPDAWGDGDPSGLVEGEAAESGR